MKNIIMVVTHKMSEMVNNELYIPIVVGNNDLEIDNSFRDNTGDNISYKNYSYCELTALYWFWKNKSENYDIVGMCHYRRYLSKNGFSDKKRFFLNNKDVEKYLKKNDIILPYPYVWKIKVGDKYHECETGTGKKKDLDMLAEVIKNKQPQYYDSFLNVTNRKWASYCNIFIMKRKLFDDYCDWLFGVLEELEKRIDITNYNKQEQRVFGYLSEILINVWAEKNKLKIKYFDMVYSELSHERQFKKNLKLKLNNIPRVFGII